MTLVDTPIPCRRFGRTNLNIPILSLGGMRFQESWSDVESREISHANQSNLENILQYAVENGLHHIETARHYGSSERQLGWAMQNIHDAKRIIQTKVPPREDPNEFEKELETSFRRLQCKRIDLLAIHGVNLPEHLDQTIRSGGCLEVVRRWQKKGLIGHVGFSTHAPTNLIVRAIETGEFDYINLHWYFIFQDNELALDAAEKFDLGVFIISPTDKGGHLHSPSAKLMSLCSPLHPIVFNDLFCLSDQRVHTLSIGASNLQDFQFHKEAIELLNKANKFLPKIQTRLDNASKKTLGKEWMSTWRQGLPSWDKTPGYINIPVLLWLYNLMEEWDMEGFAESRYRLLGEGSHWFPGCNADSLDHKVTEKDLKTVLANSPWMDEIPFILRKVRDRLRGNAVHRLSRT